MTEAEKKKFDKLVKANQKLDADVKKREARRQKLLTEVDDLSRIIKPRGIFGLVMCFINCAAAQEKVRIIQDIIRA